MKQLFLFLLFITSAIPLAGEEKGADTPKIRLVLEVSDEEIAPLNLKVSDLQTEIMTALIKQNILVQNDQKNPLLLLRLKTIQVGADYAGFVQLAFFEEASLTRNNATVSAMTWSQASLLTTAKEDFNKEMTKTILSMTNRFITEYKKAFVPAS